MRLVLLLAALASCSRAKAEPEMPTQMTLGDAARLDRDLAHIVQLRQEMERYEAEAAEVCRTYRIDPRELNRTVGVDFATGRIVRATQPSAPPGGH